MTIALRDCALATSGRDRRRWSSQGIVQHHIIDPQTDLPARGDVLRVTVIAENAVEAETRATALFMVGSAQAFDEAQARGIAAIIVTEAGQTLMTEVAA
jgi:thiamine biosynthesis lipoprotein